jgi:hypothetical protein
MSADVSTEQDATQSDWALFRDRVVEAASISRAATTNVVTALASATVGIVGVAVTLATTELHRTPLAMGMLIAIAGAVLSAVTIIISLMVEATRANKYAVRWHGLFSEYYDKAEAGEPLPPIPWGELKFARFSVGIHWKVSLPAALFLVGLLGSLAVIPIMRWYA